MNRCTIVDTKTWEVAMLKRTLGMTVIAMLWAGTAISSVPTSLQASPTTQKNTEPLTFEVATIKPNLNGYIDLGNGQRVLSGRTHCHGIDSHVVRGDLIGLPALGRCSVL